MSVSSDSLKVFVSRALSAVSGFVLIALVARELGSETLGSYVLFMALFGILSLLTDLGVKEALVKRISGDRDPLMPSRYVGAALAIKLVFLVVVGAVLLVVSNTVNDYVGFRGTTYLIGLLALHGLYTTTVYTLQGEDDVGVAANLEIGQKLVSRGVAIGLVLTGHGLIGLIVGLYVGRLCGFVGGLVSMDTTPGLPTIGACRSLWDFSKYSAISSMGGKMFTWSDTLLLGLLASQSAAGLYEVAWRVAGLMLLSTQAISTSIFPKVSLLNAEDRTEEIQQLVHTVSIVPLLIIVPGFFGGLVIGEPALELLFGQEYTSVWVALVILLFGKLFQNHHMIFVRVIQAMDRPELLARTRVVSVGANVVLNVVLIEQFGVTGAAIATSLAIVINLLLNYRYLIGFFSYTLPLATLGKTVVCAVVMALYTYAIQEQIQVTSVPVLVAIITSAVGVYALTVLFSDDLRETLNDFYYISFSSSL